jgi:predicted transposase/invertase (TIGR01784 family)
MKPVIFFAVLEKKLFPNKKEYLSHHKVSDVYTGECDIKDLSFSFLELGKFHKKVDELETNVERWAYFFKNAPETEPQELERLRKSDGIIGEAYNALSQSAFTPEELMEYERYAMKENEIETRLSDAKKIGEAIGEEKGLAKGKAEGLIEGKKETALKMLKKNYDIADISELTGLPIEEVKSLSGG